MNPLSTLEAYDLLRHCALLADRLAAAEVDQLSRAGLELEKVWLSQALVLVESQRPGLAELLARARDLPELDVVRDDYSEELQGEWVEGLERLHAGITFHASSRAPVLEALFPHAKFSSLRRISAEGVRAYASEFDRRSRLGYVKRIFGQEDYAFVEPLALAIPATIERWEACFRPSEMSEEDAIPLREELAAVAYRTERFMRQAKLLAEAALAPIDGAFESSGVGSRPRRRVGTVETEPPPPLDGAPVDDGIPLAEALGWGQPARAAGAADGPGGDAASGELAATEQIASGGPDDGASAFDGTAAKDAAPTDGDASTIAGAADGASVIDGTAAKDAAPPDDGASAIDGAADGASVSDGMVAKDSAAAGETASMIDGAPAVAPSADEAIAVANGADTKRRGRSSGAKARARSRSASAGADGTPGEAAIPAPDEAEASLPAPNEVEAAPASEPAFTRPDPTPASATASAQPPVPRRGRSPKSRGVGPVG